MPLTSDNYKIIAKKTNQKNKNNAKQKDNCAQTERERETEKQEQILAIACFKHFHLVSFFFSQFTDLCTIPTSYTHPLPTYISARNPHFVWDSNMQNLGRDRQADSDWILMPSQPWRLNLGKHISSNRKQKPTERQTLEWVG